MKKMKGLIYCNVIFSLYFVYGSYEYQLKCPVPSHRPMRARILCVNPTTYYCLQDDIKKVYTDNCSFTTFEQPGKKIIIRGGPDNGPCSDNLYQPRTIRYWTNVSTDCIYQKSLCSDEGQVEYEDGGVNYDRSCTCDNSRGYFFVNTPRNPCFCRPSEEDCSCYKNMKKDALAQSCLVIKTSRKSLDPFIFLPKDIRNKMQTFKYNTEFHNKILLTVLILIVLVLLIVSIVIVCSAATNKIINAIRISFLTNKFFSKEMGEEMHCSDNGTEELLYSKNPSGNIQTTENQDGIRANHTESASEDETTESSATDDEDDEGAMNEIRPYLPDSYRRPENLPLEESNFLRFCHLMQKVAPQAIRSKFDQTFLPADLKGIIQRNNGILQDLRSLRIITYPQWKLICPIGRVPSSTTFDVTIMLTLFRNLKDIRPLSGSYDQLPPPSDITLGGDLARIKYFRNYISHYVENIRKIDNEEFPIVWNTASQAISRIGGALYEQECFSLRTANIDGSYADVYREFLIKELELKREMNNFRRKQNKRHTKMKKILKQQGKIINKLQISTAIIPVNECRDTERSDKMAGVENETRTSSNQTTCNNNQQMSESLVQSSQSVYTFNTDGRHGSLTETSTQSIHQTAGQQSQTFAAKEVSVTGLNCIFGGPIHGGTFNLNFNTINKTDNRKTSCNEEIDNSKE